MPHFERQTNAKLTDNIVTRKEIQDILDILDVKKASGPDNISHTMMKLVSLEISLPLALIFNNSLSRGIFQLENCSCHADLQNR